MLQVLDPDSWKIINVLNQDPGGVKLTQAEVLYVDYLVSNLKATGMWAASNAIYGFVGGTEYKHKWNWKDMRDLDAVHRLSFVNSPTHNSNGISTNGANQHVNTNFNPSLNLTTRNTHLSIYLKSVGSSNTAHVSGCSDIASPTSTILFINRPNASSFLSASSANYQSVISQSNLTGYYIGNNNATNIFLYKNGVDLTTTRSVGSSTVFPNQSVYIGASNVNNTPVNYSQITFSFYSIGSGLTAQQAITSSQVITNAQSILNRA